MSQVTTIRKKPLVSIGVPVYNGEAYVVECLESLINQTYTNWECVIIDNCSTDKTNELASTFVARDKRFRLIKNAEFLNVMQNWNETYKHVSKDSKYFKVVPADDWLFENFLEEMVGMMEEHPEVGICTSYRLDGKLIRGAGLDYYHGNIFDGKRILAHELIKKIDVTGSGNSVLYRVECLKKLPGYPVIFDEFSLHVDTELAYDLLYMSKLGFIYKVLSYTRRHNDSITNSIVHKLNTSICFRDNQLKKYEEIIPNFSKYYNRYRYEYAILYTRKLLSGDKKWLEWHKMHLENKFTFSEILRALIKRVSKVNKSSKSLK